MFFLFTLGGRLYKVKAPNPLEAFLAADKKLRVKLEKKFPDGWVWFDVMGERGADW